MEVCGGEDECIEQGAWPSSKEAFSKILEKIGEKKCTGIEDGDWKENPAIYVEYDSICRWNVGEPDNRCKASSFAVQRYCPCKKKQAPTVTTTSSPPTTVRPKVDIRRRRRRDKARRRSAGKTLRRRHARSQDVKPDIASNTRRRRRRRRRRRKSR